MIEDFAGYFSGSLDSVIVIVDKLRLDDGDEAVFLAGFGVFSEDATVFVDGVVGRWVIESGAPFGEAEAVLVVFAEAGGEAIEAFGVGFFGVWEFFKALIDFDAGDDTLGCEVINEILAVIGELFGGFVEEDDAVDMVF